MLARPALARLLAAVLALATTALAPARAAESASPQCASVSADTCALARRLGRGINFGNMLESPREGQSGLKVETRFIDAAASKFATVRLPIRWSNHASPDEAATVDPAFFARVDEIVDALLARKLNVILDFHGYSQLTGHPLYYNEAGVDPAVVTPRFLNIWDQVARHYRNRPANVLFEIYNEPYSHLEGEPWNDLLARAVKIVRASNPTRTLVVGPSMWNHPKALKLLRLPADRDIIVTIHTYDPFPFTHQGAGWVGRDMPAGLTCCSDEQADQIRAPLELAATWSREHGYPIHLGEFGSYKGADLASRVTYTRIARAEAEKRGFSWTYWELASDFGVYDPARSAWRPELLDALLKN